MASKYDRSTTAETIAKDLASHIEGKVILTTGVSPGGLGAYFVEAVAHGKPKLLILAGRSPEKLKTTADAINKTGVATKILSLDVSSLAKAKEAAKEVLSWDDVPVIDVLVNNAGVMAIPYSTTVDGFEKQLGTNHLGPFLFTNLIISKLLAAKESRVVMVASDGHRLSPFRFGDYDFHKGDSYNEWAAYGQTKTANMLMAISLAEKFGSKGLTAISLHPGTINTNLGSHIDWNSQFADLQKLDKAWGNFEGWAEFQWKTLEEGSSTHVYASFAPELKEHNGAYVHDNRLANPWNAGETIKTWAKDPIEAERLWKLSEELVGQKFP